MTNNDPLTGEPLAKSTKLMNGDKDPSTAEPVDINDPVALRALAKGKLVEIIRTAPVNVSLVTAIRELLDRVEGKPLQSIMQDVIVRPRPFTIEEEKQAREALYQYALTHGGK